MAEETFGDGVQVASYRNMIQGWPVKKFSSLSLQLF
jgi:hypothetical protein